MLIILGPWDFWSDYRISLALLIPEIIDNASDYYLQKKEAAINALENCFATSHVNECFFSLKPMCVPTCKMPRVNISIYQ